MMAATTSFSPGEPFFIGTPYTKTSDTASFSAESFRAATIAYTIDYRHARSRLEAADRLLQAFDEDDDEAPKGVLRAIFRRWRYGGHVKRLLSQQEFTRYDAGQHRRYVELICAELIPQVAEERLAEAVDVFCEQIAFSLEHCERLFRTAQAAGLGIKMHAEQLSNSRGAELAASFSAWSVDHLEYLDEPGIRALQKSATVATLLPGAFYFLGETKKPPVELLRRYQVPMALASDLNPGSSPLASLQLMLNMGCVLFGLTPEEALLGTTHHAAAALGLGGELGSIAIGKHADMLLWNIEDPAQLACQFGATPLRQRIFAGEFADV